MNTANGDELRAFIERYERLEAEKKERTEDQKEVMAEAKGRGYTPAVLKKIIAIRAKDPSKLSEEEAEMELYLSAMGM